MIGDSEKDVEAGKIAGCRTARLIEAGNSTDCSADVVASSLLNVIRKILDDEEYLRITDAVEPAGRRETGASIWLPNMRAVRSCRVPSV